MDKIIVVNGPGSFTGIRIGITIAKTYGWALNIPVISISSLYAMAISTNQNGLLVPIIDARRGYVYAGVYNNDKKQIMPDQYVELNQFINKLKELNSNWIFISNDSFNFETIKYNPDILKIVDLCKNNPPVDAHEVNPIYLKLTEAEEKINDM